MSAFVLALCSATGLLTGVITREVASAAPANTLALAQATATPTIAPATATATSIPTNTPGSSNQFAVSISISGQPHPGQGIGITGSISKAGAPVAGARCTLGAEAGSDSLLQTWPDETMTDATGKCAWAITLPEQTALGSYRIRLDGYTTQYHAWSFATVRVS
ncbi:MAG TPA: hypothetical protein VH393_01155 [Ktedonobacterales bacterium]